MSSIRYQVTVLLFVMGAIGGRLKCFNGSFSKVCVLEFGHSISFLLLVYRRCVGVPILLGRHLAGGAFRYVFCLLYGDRAIVVCVQRRGAYSVQNVYFSFLGMLGRGRYFRCVGVGAFFFIV